MTRRLAVVAMLAACGAPDDGDDISTPRPTATDLQLSTPEDTNLALTAMVRAANPPVGCALTVLFDHDTPQHGQITKDYSLDNYGVESYVPDPSVHGTDTLTYMVESCDGKQSARATITLTVESDGIGYEQTLPLDDSGAFALASGDLDGDGRIDLVATSTNSSIVVLLNRTASAGAYAVQPARFEGGHEPMAVAVADLDGDGRLDIVTAAGTDGLVVLRNITVAGGALAFDAPVYIPAGTAVGVVAVDLDGDGRADLASIDQVGHQLDVRLNASSPGTLAFGARTAFATPAAPSGLASVDADGAGGMDLAVLSTAANGDGSFSLFVNATALGDTVPAFGARIDRAAGKDPTSIFVADLDGDQRPEIGVMNGSLWIYANQSAAGSPPSYEAARVIDADASARFAAPADLDGHGELDLLLVLDQQGEPFAQYLNRTTPAAGYAFDAHASILAADRARVTTARPTAVRLVELDGVAPAEIVVATASGTLVLFGD